MSDATIRIEFGDLIAAMQHLSSEAVPETLAVALRASIQAMIRDVVVNRMHDRGRYIGVVTGAGVRSVTGSAVAISPTRVTASFGSSLRYIRAHEVGFHGRVNVRAFDRRIPSRTAIRA